MIIQVERQIILSVHKNRVLYFFRGIIALMMALIGSLIIDQILFKEDIEQKQIYLLDNKVNVVLPAKTSELKHQISEIDSALLLKDAERKILMDDITRNPTYKIVTQQTSKIPISTTTLDSAQKPISKVELVKGTSSTISSIQNPKMSLIPSIDQQIFNLRNQKAKLDSALIMVRPSVEKEIKSKVGFLDELNVMYQLVTDSGVALIVYLIWFFFLLGLEMFILASKLGDRSNDYDETIRHQMALHLKKLELLSNPIRESSNVK